MINSKCSCTSITNCLNCTAIDKCVTCATNYLLNETAIPSTCVSQCDINYSHLSQGNCRKGMIGYIQLLKDQKYYNYYNIDKLNKYSSKVNSFMLSPVKT